LGEKKMVHTRSAIVLAVLLMVFSMLVPLSEDVSIDERDQMMGGEDPVHPRTRSDIGELMWEFITDDWIFSSPCIGDLNKDGDLDIVFGNGVHEGRGMGGEVFAVDNQGREIWNFSCGKDFPASPVIYDLFDDGYPEVLIGSENGNFFCLNGAEGTVVWEYQAYDCENSAAVADIDLDGHPEVLVCETNNLIVLDRNGDLEWRGKGNNRCAPTVVDLEGDGELEVITCDMDTVYVYDGNGQMKWSTYAGWYVASSPGIGDMNGDGIMDIVVGAYTGGLFAISGSSELLWEANISEGVCDSSPAVYDLNRDGHPEVFFETEGGDSRLYSVSHMGEILWSYDLSNGYSSPAIADVNNDGINELVAGNWGGGVHCFNGQGKRILDFQCHQMASSTIIADIDGNGYLEVLMTSTWCGPDKGYLQCYSLNTSCGKGEIVWGSFQFNTCNTGNPLIKNVVDDDLDDDGYLNGIDAFPKDPTQWKDTDSDGYGDNPDGNDPDMFPEDPEEWRDSDGDGVGDNGDAFPEDPVEWKDSDGDGIGDNGDAFPDDPEEWVDTDEDGVGDNSDPSPEDPTEWSDIDKDGVADNKDAFPEDPNEWKDTDGDGVGDNTDRFPEDPERWQDTDLDGVSDDQDRFPYDRTEWEDSDNDGVGNNGDAFPYDPSEQADSDSDGVGDNEDAFPSDRAASLDTDGDGYPDRWNIGKGQKDSTTGLVLDEYPNDPDRYKKEEGFALLILIVLVLIAVLIALTVGLFMLMFTKRERAVLKDEDDEDISGSGSSSSGR